MVFEGDMAKGSGSFFSDCSRSCRIYAGWRGSWLFCLGSVAFSVVDSSDDQSFGVGTGHVSCLSVIQKGCS